MTIKQPYTIDAIKQNGIQCSFSTGCQPFQGWIMPDGKGVFYDEGILIEFEPETIFTSHSEGLRLARQGAIQRFIDRDRITYIVIKDSDWNVTQDKWVKQIQIEMYGVPGQLNLCAAFEEGSAVLKRFYTDFFNGQAVEF